MIGTSAVALALAVPASAAAATGAAGAGGAGTGGAGFVPVPEISKVSCLSTCVGKGKARRPRAGGRIRIAGRNLGGATKVTFHGAAGRSDDVSVRVRPRSARRLDVRVPLDARSGPVSVAAQQRMKNTGIVRARLPGVPEEIADKVCRAVQRLRAEELYKPPGVGETIAWAQALLALGEAGDLDSTLGAALKVREDIDRVRSQGVLADV